MYSEIIAGFITGFVAAIYRQEIQYQALDKATSIYGFLNTYLPKNTGQWVHKLILASRGKDGRLISIILPESFVNKLESTGTLSWIDILTHNESFLSESVDGWTRLEIHYQIADQPYIVVFPENDASAIKFPVYSEEDLQRYRSEIISISVSERELSEDDNLTSAPPTQNRPIEDLIDTLAQYAGPLGNFYEDLGLNPKLSWIIHENTPAFSEGESVLLTDEMYSEHRITDRLKLTL